MRRSTPALEGWYMAVNSTSPLHLVTYFPFPSMCLGSHIYKTWASEWRISEVLSALCSKSFLEDNLHIPKDFEILPDWSSEPVTMAVPTVMSLACLSLSSFSHEPPCLGLLVLTLAFSLPLLLMANQPSPIVLLLDKYF